LSDKKNTSIILKATSKWKTIIRVALCREVKVRENINKFIFKI